MKFVSISLKTEVVVRDRYAAAAKTPEAALCCPVEYNAELLKAIPKEVVDKDYGCGDPSRHLKLGETVLDLGSGAGKICFIAAQVVGPTGRVIGVDMTDDMLAVARANAPIVAERLGFANVEFRKGRIQDLALDLERFDAELAEHPIRSSNEYFHAEQRAAELRLEHPLVPQESIDVVVSNCVLNLVDPRDKKQVFHEVFRALKPGGRAVISDIISEVEVPESMRADPTLWSGCISGALQEGEFIQAFKDAGFCCVKVLRRDECPWQTVNDIEFRAITLEAVKS